MLQACIRDKLLERTIYTPFVDTKEKAKEMAQAKIERMEAFIGSEGCHRFEIDHIAIS